MPQGQDSSSRSGSILRLLCILLCLAFRISETWVEGRIGGLLSRRDNVLEKRWLDGEGGFGSLHQPYPPLSYRVPSTVKKLLSESKIVQLFTRDPTTLPLFKERFEGSCCLDHSLYSTCEAREMILDSNLFRRMNPQTRAPLPAQTSQWQRRERELKVLRPNSS